MNGKHHAATPSAHQETELRCVRLGGTDFSGLAFDGNGLQFLVLRFFQLLDFSSELLNRRQNIMSFWL